MNKIGLTTLFLNQVRDDVKTDIENEVTNAAIGTDSTPFATSDTALGAEVFDDTIDEFDSSATDTVVASFRVLTTEGNTNTIREVGFFDADPDTTGNLVSRNVITAISKTTDIQLFLDLSIKITITET